MVKIKNDVSNISNPGTVRLPDFLMLFVYKNMRQTISESYLLYVTAINDYVVNDSADK